MPDELDLAPVTTLVYGVPKLALGLPVDADPTDEVKADQKEFFRLLYNLLVDKDRGPRLPTLIVALGPDRIRTPARPSAWSRLRRSRAEARRGQVARHDEEQHAARSPTTARSAAAASPGVIASLNGSSAWRWQARHRRDLRRPEKLRPSAARRPSMITAIAAEPRTAPIWRVAL